MRIRLLFFLLIISCSVFAAAVKSHRYHERISLAKLFAKARSEQAFPGGCVVAGTKEKILLNKCYGYYTYAHKAKDSQTSLFDIASLTKVIATTAAIMKLYEQNRLALDDKVVQYLPEFKGPNQAQTDIKASLTIKQLLSHTSGLPPDNFVYTWKQIFATPVVVYPDQREIYSDLNFVLLAKIVERISQQSFSSYVDEQVFKPLQMKDTYFKPNRKQRIRAVPTEYWLSQDKFFKGVVHDPTARYLGGVAGNAGLFSTASDLARFAQMMLNDGRYGDLQLFKPETIALFTKPTHIISKSSRALGWDTAFNEKVALPLTARGKVHFVPEKLLQYYEPPHQFTAGRYIDSKAFGHTGYTGVSLWVSKEQGLFVVLLTNRVFPMVTKARLPGTYYWRQRITSAVWENLGFTRRNSLKAMPRPHWFEQQKMKWFSV